MGDVFNLVFILSCAALPFVLMVVMWRQMKKARQAGYDRVKERPHEEPWQEKLTDSHGASLAKDFRPNDDLIEQGARSTQSRWPIDNG